MDFLPMSRSLLAIDQLNCFSQPNINLTICNQFMSPRPACRKKFRLGCKRIFHQQPPLAGSEISKKPAKLLSLNDDYDDDDDDDISISTRHANVSRPRRPLASVSSASARRPILVLAEQLAGATRKHKYIGARA